MNTDKLQPLMHRLPELIVNFVYTRKKEGDLDSGRMDRERLQRILGTYLPETLILLCGPSGFMLQIRTDLKSLGYPGRMIKTEAFRM